MRQGWYTPDRRDYNAVEQEMIRKGDRPGAKVHWHNRQQPKESKPNG